MSRAATSALRPMWAALALLVAAGCNLDLPPGCGDTLVARDDEAQCDSGARCEHVKGEPSYVARWILFIGESSQDANGDEVAYTAGAMKKRRECVAEFLNNRGVVLLDRGSEAAPYVTAEGIEQNFRAVLDFEPIRAFELQCSGGVCENCEGLEVEACAADPFCSAIAGQGYASTEACLLAPVAGGCASGDQVCDDAETWAADDAGECWKFASSCVPAGWGTSEAQCVALGVDVPACG